MSYSERRKEQAQKTETEILNAALELMRKDGFEAVTVRDICNRAGITTGAFYHHFKSKEELFDKGFAPMDRFMLRALETCPDENPVVKLRVILEHYGKFMEACGPLAAQYYQRRLGHPDTASLDPTSYIHALLEGCLVQAQEQGYSILKGDPAWTAEFCYCHFRGIVIDWLLRKKEYSLQERMMEEFELFQDILSVPRNNE